MTNEEYDNCPYCNGKMFENQIYGIIRCTRCNWYVRYGTATKEDRVKWFNEFAQHIREDLSEGTE